MRAVAVKVLERISRDGLSFSFFPFIPIQFRKERKRTIANMKSFDFQPRLEGVGRLTPVGSRLFSREETETLTTHAIIGRRVSISWFFLVKGLFFQLMIAAVVQVSKLVWKLKTLTLSVGPTPA